MNLLSERVVAAQKGDIDAYTAIVWRFQDMATGYAYAILKDFHLAEDAAQEAFIQAYLDLPQLREPAAFPGWFRKIVFRHSDRIQRKRRGLHVSLESIPELPSEAKATEAKLEEQEIEDQVHLALQALPEMERQVATLFYISEYSRQDIVDFLQVPMATVIYRLRSARRKLKERMLEMSNQNLKGDAPSKDERFTEYVMSRLEAIEKLHGMFVRSLSSTFSEVMGKEVETDTAYVDLTTYDRVVKHLSLLPSCTYKVTMEPMGGDAVFSMFAPVVHGLLRSGAIESHPLTQEEVHNLSAVATRVLKSLEAAWKDHQVTLTNATVETDPESVRLAAPEDSIIIVGIDINVAGYRQEETNPKGPKGIRPAACLCYPLSTLESILHALEAV